MPHGSTKRRGWTPELRERIISSAVLPAGLVFLELAFKLATGGSVWPSVLVIIPFSVGIGLLFDLLCSLARSHKARCLAKLALLLFAGVLFCVEYFVFRQFKVYYDPATVLSGAGDVAGQFGGEALQLILSPTGLAHIAVFLLPAIAYAFWGVARGLDHATRMDLTDTVVQACVCAEAHLLAFLLIACLAPMRELYTSRYSFQGSVEGFGMLTSLRREAQSRLFGSGSTLRIQVPSQTQDDPVESEKDEAEATPVSEPEAEEPFVPEDAVLDIDFEALAASTDNTVWADLDRYVGSLEPSKTNEYTGLFEGYNLIFISAEAFSKEAIRPDTTPTLYQMWQYGIQLTDFYQFDTAGTTGGECANLFGLLATEGGSSVKMTASHNNYLTMGNLLNREGYEGWAFHNNSYTYYGRDTTHNNLGYNHGYMGYGNGMEQWVTWQWPQSDLEMVQGSFENLYGNSTPFNVYYMSVSGHSNYDPWDNMMAQKNWDVVADLPYSDRVKGYLAANVELDRAMRYLLRQLKKHHIYRKTVIVISADHFPYGLDDDAPTGQMPYLSELYGYDVYDLFQRDHSAPIIWCGSLPKQNLHIQVDEPTSSIDLLPTLCNLFGVPWDSRLLPGRDVLDPSTEGIAFDLSYDWRTELGTYWAGSGTFQPAEGAEVPDGYVEEHNAAVANKIAYCDAVLTSDYYRHVFGDPEDVQEAHDAGVARRLQDQ